MVHPLSGFEIGGQCIEAGMGKVRLSISRVEIFGNGVSILGCMAALRFKKKAEGREWVCGWEFEMAARAEGAHWIAGVDEVGRGPLFGPVVAAAVILPAGAELDGLTDSKKLSERERERFDERVRKIAVAWAIAEVDAATIDRINILEASRLAMRLAAERLEPAGRGADWLLVDGKQRVPVGCKQTTIVQGDARSLSIAAASVIAKVYRDGVMRQMEERFPGYGLGRNMGYPTAEHREALKRLGATELHRRSFGPVAECLQAEAVVEFGLVEG
jgi:ribonuclease HII